MINKNPSIIAIENAEYFNLKENWGDPRKIDPILIQNSDLFRKTLGFPVHLSPVEGAVYAEDGHEDLSYHYIIEHRNDFAMAADVFPECNLFHAWCVAQTISAFNGIGIYPFWKWEEKGLRGGLHLDIRPGPRKLWWRDENKKYWDLTNKKKNQELFTQFNYDYTYRAYL